MEVNLMQTNHQMRILLTNDDGSGTQLFNLAEDPGESNDLTAVHPERVREMKRVLLDWRASL